MGAHTVKLNSGHEMPLVGFGLWKVNTETCAEQVYNAIKAGYRLFDGALDYGNEKQAGEGVARAIREGIVKREELFLVSKLWNTFHDEERVVPICKKQLADWGIDYFDLFIVHFPISLKYVEPSVKYPPGFKNEHGEVVRGTASLAETWRAMEDVQKQGLARSIGVSNYNGQTLQDLFSYAKTKPATLQIEHHPYLQQEGLLKLCRDNGIAVTAYSTFGPLSFLEMNNIDRARMDSTKPLMETDTIKNIAAARSKTPAQVLLRWATQRGVAVIPKSNNPGRLAQNLDVLDWDLTQQELDEIKKLDAGLRFNDPLLYGFNLPIFV